MGKYSVRFNFMGFGLSFLESGTQYDLIQGVRYKNSSIKLVDHNGEFLVIIKKYYFFGLFFRTNTAFFSNLDDAEAYYDGRKVDLSN